MKNTHEMIVTLEAKPGLEAELAIMLQKVAELSRAEVPCLEYRVHRNTENPAEFILYECW